LLVGAGDGNIPTLASAVISSAGYLSTSIELPKGDRRICNGLVSRRSNWVAAGVEYGNGPRTLQKALAAPSS
jgi:hypothetical protein